MDEITVTEEEKESLFLEIAIDKKKEALIKSKQDEVNAFITLKNKEISDKVIERDKYIKDIRNA